MKITSRLAALRRAEHENTVLIIEALVVCWRQRAYLPLGYSSMWAYLTEGLRYSPGAASRRYKAMQCALKVPQVIAMLSDHRVSLSTLARAESLLGEVSDPQLLLDRITGKSASEVDRVVAAQRPVRRKPRERVARVAVKHDDPLFAQSAEPAESRVALKTTLTEERYEAFEEARAIVSRKYPGATVEDVLNELVDHYLKAKAPKERKAPKKTPTSRHIPKATRDEVMLRDGQRCTFVGSSGRRCNATHDLQIDHVRPWALGGTHDPENLRVLCAAHNRHRARQTFGTKKCPEPGQLRSGGDTSTDTSRGPGRPLEQRAREQEPSGIAP